MPAKKWPLLADAGATFRLGLRYRLTDGTPRDFTGSTVSLVLLPRAATGDPIASYEGTGDDDGVISIVVTDEVTATWDAGTVAYRLQVEEDGAKDFLLAGPFTVRTPGDV